MKYLKLFESDGGIDGISPSQLYCIIDRLDMTIVEVYQLKEAAENRTIVLNEEFRSNMKPSAAYQKKYPDWKTTRMSDPQFNTKKYYCQTLESAIEDIKDEIRDEMASWNNEDY